MNYMHAYCVRVFTLSIFIHHFRASLWCTSLLLLSWHGAGGDDNDDDNVTVARLARARDDDNYVGAGISM
jgi:hypothetical protein